MKNYSIEFGTKILIIIIMTLMIHFQNLKLPTYMYKIKLWVK